MNMLFHWNDLNGLIDGKKLCLAADHQIFNYKTRKYKLFLHLLSLMYIIA